MVRNRLQRGIKEFATLSDENRLWVAQALRNKRVLEPEVFQKFVREVLNDTTKKKPSVFLSHSHQDKKFVRKLAHRLKGAGIHVWLDEAEIKVGESLIHKLREGIDAVDFLVVVLSRASIVSAWVQKEVEIAMNQEIKSKTIKVLPIMKEAVQLPGFLEGKLYLDFTSKTIRSKTGDQLVDHILHYHRSSL